MTDGERETIEAQIGDATNELMELKKRIGELRQQMPAEAVEDYQLLGMGGRQTRLSDLFGEHDDLIVVHNMGKGCSYCTLWADGFVGLLPHLENRAAFVISSPDDPETQQAFAESRGWRFPMVSVKESAFARDMGFMKGEGEYWPGYSTFHREADGRIVRVGKDFFGPGDDYCALWPMFDLLSDGPNGWQPRVKY